MIIHKTPYALKIPLPESQARILAKKIKLIFLLESPPVSGNYFCAPDGRTTEQLFSSMMKLIKCQPASKADGLAEFARQSYVLAEATYSPVNHIKNARKRNEKMPNSSSANR